jgi:hypothetical protein
MGPTQKYSVPFARCYGIAFVSAPNAHKPQKLQHHFGRQESRLPPRHMLRSLCQSHRQTYHQTPLPLDLEILAC